MANFDDYFFERFKITPNNLEKHLELKIKFLHGHFKVLNAVSPIRSTDAILEIGAGYGAFIQILKTAGCNCITAAELDHNALRHLLKIHDIKTISIPINDFEFDQKFDSIYAFEVIEHLHDPISDLRKIFAALRPGGTFKGTTPYPFRRNITSDITHMFVLHPDNWRRIFHLVGFDVVQIRSATILPYLYRLNKIFSYNINIYIPLLKIVSTTIFICRRPLE
jgi:SAM-dependent methyltransferase